MSCPSAFYGILFVLLIAYLTISNIMKLLSKLSGDVELNPGFFSPESAKRSLALLEILPKIYKGQTTLIDELVAIKQKQECVEGKF